MCLRILQNLTCGHRGQLQTGITFCDPHRRGEGCKGMVTSTRVIAGLICARCRKADNAALKLNARRIGAPGVGGMEG